VGAYYQDFSSPTDLTNKTVLGFPTGPYSLTLSPGVPPLPPGVVDTAVLRGSTTEEVSVFANLTFHLGDKAEVSAGARYIDFESNSTLLVNGGPPSPLDDGTRHAEEKPTVWNLAGSYRFTDDFMAYANIGTSWRAGPSVVGIFRPATPNITQFTELDSEDSTSYEIGFKADFLDDRLRLNVSAFHQDFENFIYRGPSVWYTNLGRTGPVPAQFNFNANVDGTIDGAEVDLAFQATENFNVGLNFAYAKGEMDNGVVACNDFDGDGLPDSKPPAAPSVTQIQTAVGTPNPLAEAVASCAVNDRLSFAPDWSATLQAEYAFPLTSSMDIFGRGLYTYYTDNVNDPNNAYDNVDAYGLLNLYAGLRSSDGAWEVALFGRNVTDTEEILTSGAAAAATPFTNLAAGGLGTSLAGPYMTTSFTPLREFGLSVRYSFGSR
jgi:iron complex outermembrane receptor protein